VCLEIVPAAAKARCVGPGALFTEPALPHMISREAARRAARLHTTVIPATRLAGLTAVCALMPLHNAAVLGDPRWSSVGAFALAAYVYCLGSWLILKAHFVRCRRFPLEDLFLVADIILILFAIALTGGPASWLFLLLAARCVDQLTGGFRRAVWFNHLTAGGYALYLLIAARHGHAPWTLYAAKLTLLYLFNWYCTLSARTVVSVGARARRTELAKRKEAEIAGAMAHAIRTTTDGIVVLTELLAQTALDTRQQDYVRGLVQHSRDLLGKLPSLDTSAAETGAMDVQETVFSPHLLIEDVASLLRPLAEMKGLDFRIEIAGQTPHSMTGDPVKIRQVLLSITHNSIRFTETGFVEVRCWRLPLGHIAFQVQDSGPGIPAHVQRRVSADFVRADGTAWHRYRGTQIGLAVSKRLVDLMSGRLVFHSEPLLGTTVRVELPIEGTKSFFVLPPASALAGRRSID
jgi:signal transduction histidine kinase